MRLLSFLESSRRNIINEELVYTVEVPKFLSFRIPLGVVVRVMRFSSVYPSSILLENDVLQGRREISSFFKMKKDVKVGGIHCPQPIF